MALRLAGVAPEIRYLRSRSEVRRVSRTGRLPVLEIGGERIVDSMRILDRLEELYPQAGLSPDDPAQRLQDRLWEHFATDAIYWNGYYLRWVRPDTRERFFMALFGRRPFWMRWAARVVLIPQQVKRAMVHGSGGKSPQEIHAELERAFEMVEQGLAGGPFLQGRRQPGRGDLALASLMVQAGFRDTLTEMREMILDRPLLVAHLKRVLDACGMQRTRWLED